MTEVAWSQSATPPCVHFLMISCIVWFKQTSVLSKGTNELFYSSKAPTSFIGCAPLPMVLIKPISMTSSPSKWHSTHTKYV
jgi:hypothetical protein